MLQAPILDGFSFDRFSLFDDGCCPAEVGIGGCRAFQAFVIALMIIVLNESLNLRLLIVWQEVIFQ